MRIWKENWLSFIRYGMLMLLVVFIVALLGADKTSETKIETVEKAVEKEVPLTGMHSVQSQMVKRLYGLNVNDYEGVVLYISDSNMGGGGAVDCEVSGYFPGGSRGECCPDQN